MSEKMTLEQVRDWHKGRADGIRQGITTGSASVHDRLADAIVTHLATLPSAVPDGWKLVPIEPTEEMLEQAATHDLNRRTAETDQWNHDTWSFMLDAAPEPPNACREAMLTQRGDAQDARDVARYRWLRANAYECDERLSFNNMYLECADGKLLLDKSIDAAMLASGEG